MKDLYNCKKNNKTSKTIRFANQYLTKQVIKLDFEYFKYVWIYEIIFFVYVFLYAVIVIISIVIDGIETTRRSKLGKELRIEYSSSTLHLPIRVARKRTINNQKKIFCYCNNSLQLITSEFLLLNKTQALFVVLNSEQKRVI